MVKLYANYQCMHLMQQWFMFRRVALMIVIISWLLFNLSVVLFLCSCMLYWIFQRSPQEFFMDCAEYDSLARCFLATIPTMLNHTNARNYFIDELWFAKEYPLASSYLNPSADF